MQTKPSLFTAAERRIGLMALVAAAILTLAIMIGERAWSPSLGIYGASPAAPRISDVVDARPLSRAALP